jgi:Xaa-Pro aminopeptidase
VDHRDRLRRAAHAAERAGLGALLVAPSADLVYLTGYDPPPLERLTCLVIRPGQDPVLVVPELERPLAEDTGVATLADVRSWGETEDPHAMVARLADGSERVGCSDRMWAQHVLRLQRVIRRAAFVPASAVLSGIRAVKDVQELGLLKRAARYADQAFHRVLGMRLETLTERDLAGRLGDLLLEMGNEEVAFTIVGSGPNGASPHHRPSSREIQAGDPVVMDFGGRAGGYCSDITRTVAVRKMPKDFDHAYEVVREAQDRAVRTVRPGVPAQEVDRAAREIIAQAGYGDLFVHRTGHGIGLEEHEPPYIVEGNAEPLRPGMCFSIEPGVYVPGEWGIRIEDIVSVTEDGATRLNLASRDLEVVR